MLTLTFAVLLFSCYLFYSTSKKVKIANFPYWLTPIREYRLIMRWGSIGLLLSCMLFHGLHLGFGAQFFSFFAFLMLGFSVLILFFPYRIWKWSYLGILFILSFCIELFCF